ncbi:hypothetical protein [Fodinicola feengrottensis]|uniref:hypothetical protein n=1 Tax=Fodinicola feengrottensis TaxID=435914 RepID=UPI0031DC7479
MTILLAAVFASGAPAAAETGLHCNQNVCFDVHGKKLNVSGVDGYYSNKNYSIHCGFMILFVNGKQSYQSNELCTVPYGWGPKPMHVNINRNFANGTQICAEIRGTQGHKNLNGHPCITVHS